MIEQQIRPWDVLDTRVLDVIQAIPREAFVDEKHKPLAFADLEIPIGHDQVMMSPKVEARMLQALRISPSDHVLEIGTGSGFVTACLAKMACRVTTCEYFDELAQQAQTRLQQQQIDNVRFITGDAFDLLNAFKTYDVIAITGSVPEDVSIFSNLLNDNGRLFCIMGQKPAMSATLVTCVTAGNCREESLFETDIPALLSTSVEQEFSF